MEDLEAEVEFLEDKVIKLENELHKLQALLAVNNKKEYETTRIFKVPHDSVWAGTSYVIPSDYPSAQTVPSGDTMQAQQAAQQGNLQGGLQSGAALAQEARQSEFINRYYNIASGIVTLNNGQVPARAGATLTNQTLQQGINAAANAGGRISNPFNPWDDGNDNF